MREEELKKEIEVLRSALTGNLLEDIEIQQKIYEIKKMLKPEIVENPELDDDEGCLSCGA
jgi:hypothetical protein